MAYILRWDPAVEALVKRAAVFDIKVEVLRSWGTIMLDRIVCMAHAENLNRPQHAPLVKLVFQARRQDPDVSYPIYGTYCDLSFWTDGAGKGVLEGLAVERGLCLRMVESTDPEQSRSAIGEQTWDMDTQTSIPLTYGHGDDSFSGGSSKAYRFVLDRKPDHLSSCKSFNLGGVKWSIILNVRGYPNPNRERSYSLQVVCNVDQERHRGLSPFYLSRIVPLQEVQVQDFLKGTLPKQQETEGSQKMLLHQYENPIQYPFMNTDSGTSFKAIADYPSVGIEVRKVKSFPALKFREIIICGTIQNS